jgi:signal transduction histidine kinase
MGIPTKSNEEPRSLEANALTAEEIEELLNPFAWSEPIERFARSTGLAVAMADRKGRLAGPCANPQELWKLLQGDEEGGCAFCLEQTASCATVAAALDSGAPLPVLDQALLAHVAVPVMLYDRVVALLLAGQVFENFPEQLAIERVARDAHVSPQKLWDIARRQRPFGRSRLLLCADLLAVLGRSFVQARYGAIAARRQAQEVVALSRDVSEHRRLVVKAREADHRKDEFLAMLSHELRNPLAPIHNAVQLLRRKLDAESPVQEFVGVIERQVNQIVRLVDDLLDVSRINLGKIVLKRETIELSTVIRHAVESVQVMADNRGHEVTVQLPLMPIYLNADFARLSQVVGNLLTNAIKYSEPHRWVRIDAKREAEFAVIAVRDGGIGLTADQLARIFELFTQVDQTLDRSQGGLGVGLNLVKTLVEMHGGTITASSEGLGLGSEFTIRLPAKQLSAAAEIVPPAVGRLSARRRVMIVDDNRDATEVLAELLKLDGHEAYVVHDGLAALDAVQRWQPEVILHDIGLPQLDGYEIARRLRERHGRKIMLIAITGWGQDTDRRMSKEAGFDHHLVKPVSLVVLAQLLEDLAP